MSPRIAAGVSSANRVSRSRPWNACSSADVPATPAWAVICLTIPVAAFFCCSSMRPIISSNRILFKTASASARVARVEVAAAPPAPRRRRG